MAIAYLFENTDLITRILLIVFTLSFLVQLYYYLFIYLKAGFTPAEPEEKPKSLPPVSVIICARDEAGNLSENLPEILNQDYPDFEVVVVNDCSEDETEDVLRDFENKYKNLKVSTIKKDPNFPHGKKLALTIGIKAASREYLLLTDADCKPAGKNWIRLMSRNFNDKKEVVLGTGLYLRKKGFLNLIIRFETAFIFMQYFGFARAGKPYMGVGRNLAYTRDLFFRNKGFASHTNLKSGDDDLFIGKVATKSNTALEKHPESFTYSNPQESWASFIDQKRRHLTTGKFYQQSLKWLLGTEFGSRVLLNISFIVLLFIFPRPELPLAVYILLLIVKTLCFNIVFRSLYEKYLFLPSLLLEPLMPLFYGYLHLLNHLDRKRYKWN